MTLSVVVLCGGHGTRIKSILGDVPKILAPIGDKAFIDYLLLWISSSLGAIPHNIILSTCIGHSQIEEYISSRSLPCCLSKEVKPLGTLGAVIDVINKNKVEENLLVLNGDTIFDIDFETVFEKFMSNTDFPLLAVKPPLENGRYGGYSTSNSGVIRFSSNDPEYVSLGAFFCKSSNLALFNNRVPTEPSRGLMLDRDFLDHSNIRIFPLSSNKFFIDIGVPADYELAQKLVPSFFA